MAFCGLYITIAVHHKRELGQNTMQESRGRNGSRMHRETLFTGLYPFAFSTYLFIQPVISAQRLHSPWKLSPPKPLIMKRYLEICLYVNLMEAFSWLEFPFPRQRVCLIFTKNFSSQATLRKKNHLGSIIVHSAPRSCGL